MEKTRQTAIQRMPKEALDQNRDILEFYRQHQKTKDILERTAIALGRKKVYKTISTSTSNCEINTDAIYSTTQ